MDPFKVRVWNMVDMTDEDKQRLRLRRLLMALMAYSIPTSVMVAAWALGLLKVEALYLFSVAPMVANCVFFWLIKSGRNLR